MTIRSKERNERNSQFAKRTKCTVQISSSLSLTGWGTSHTVAASFNTFIMLSTGYLHARSAKYKSQKEKVDMPADTVSRALAVSDQRTFLLISVTGNQGNITSRSIPMAATFMP